MRPPRALMIFAAGFGTRMGALTAARPKPLIPVAGRPLIDRALDIAAAAGCDPVVVNVHYLGDQIAGHLAHRGIAISWERERILETGGGLRHALPLLGPGAVMTLNPDAVWSGPNPLAQLAGGWDGGRMGALLLLAPTARAQTDGGRADFALAPDGRLRRHAVAGGEGFTYLGAQVIDPADLDRISGDAFSLNLVWDRMMAEGRLYGAVYPGDWCDVGRPEGIAAAEAMLREAGDA